MREGENPAGTADAARRPHLMDVLSRHPLAPILVSFLLTGVVGSMLTSHFSALRQQEADLIAQRDGRRHAAVEMARLFTERITRAELLSAAIIRGAAAEIIERAAQQYDDAETAWLLRRQEALLLANEVLDADDYKAFLHAAETRLVGQRMIPIRECLDRARSQEGNGEATAVLAGCHMETLLRECRPCSEALMDLFFNLATISEVHHGTRRAAQIREQAWAHVEQACP